MLTLSLRFVTYKTFSYSSIYGRLRGGPSEVDGEKLLSIPIIEPVWRELPSLDLHGRQDGWKGRVSLCPIVLWRNSAPKILIAPGLGWKNRLSKKYRRGSGTWDYKCCPSTPTLFAINLRQKLAPG